MLSAVTTPRTLGGLERNTLGDGVFHLGTYLITIGGVLWRVRTSRRGARTRPADFICGLLIGWGAFNLVEGLVDHQWLGLHHV